MTENTKTIAILIIAGAVLSLALITRPRPAAVSAESMVGKALFPTLDDPSKVLQAKRLKIVTFDESTSTPREFDVEQKSGVWTLPAYKDFPVDAAKQLASAAGALVNLTVLDQVGHGVADHELYGVVEPKPDDDQAGKPGIGKLVVIDDGEGTKPIARLIIGKQDKQSHADEFGGAQKELRFVRIAGQDPVYRVALKTDRFSTKFEDWVETDLLKLKPWDITEVKLRDYKVAELFSPDHQYDPKIEHHADIDLAFEDTSSKWDLKKLLDYKDNKPKEVKLKDDQELNSTPLNDMKNALGGLKIVNVTHKPERLSADLKTDRNSLTEETANDLLRRGFPPLLAGDHQFEIGSNDGEVTVGLKDGVEYVLRFGNEVISRNSSGDNKDGEDKKADTADDAKDQGADAEGAKKDKSSTNRQRYIMVMAQFNPDLIPKPTLEPVPESKPAADKPADAAKGTNTKADAKAADSKKAGDAKADKEKSDKSKSDDAKADDKKSDEKVAEEDPDVREAERARIEKQNRIKQDEYNDKVKAGQDRVKELNARFADWYYVVSDETYRKIHLGEDQIVKKKTPEKAADATVPPNPFTPKSLPASPAKK
jgi:Domain of unknown function (DUF4340)